MCSSYEQYSSLRPNIPALNDGAKTRSNGGPACPSHGSQMGYILTSRVDVDVIAQPGRVETRARLPSRVLAASSRQHGLCCAGGTYRLSWLHCKYRAPRQSVYGYDQSGLARSRRSTNPLIPITELRIPAHIRSPHMHALHACVHTLHTASVRYVHLTQGRFSPLTEACPPTVPHVLREVSTMVCGRSSPSDLRTSQGSSHDRRARYHWSLGFHVGSELHESQECSSHRDFGKTVGIHVEGTTEVDVR